MKFIYTFLLASLVVTGCKNNKKEQAEASSAGVLENTEHQEDTAKIEIEPISHATAAINWKDVTFYIDPVGGAEAFEGKANPDFILITDIHGDHLSVETLQGLDLQNIDIIVPQTVKEKLPGEMSAKLQVLDNGGSLNILDFKITAIPMYNLPEKEDAFHVKGRGNGYVVEKDGQRLYIAGDTEDIPEMRNLKNIELALIPMNLPYTMTVEAAAEGVLAFNPKVVIPYHYRGKDGFADVDKFKSLVNQGNKDIEVRLLNWYPDKEE
ncbi:L-ascorbate metabolism protein UlaG, beta-lactamase superfamily [Salegentibacter echinorum]|uniref:L-ascorbate metabolism protein UlaG, beta-lactamase superfamily n=1 Tax=Salegentibacter echinorum TaxID=1073325 RepID=A0A1M5CYX4_SALEC|nr:MBL fold metallo-hydrolase [Salegentibacter echinorum]SHF59948.1 L-ascorbate metabolism protein UlaG, beta-lactamase superfamily [Salegentibacter echinorum]